MSMKLPQDLNSTPLPGFEYTTTRAVATAGAASSNAAIPTGSAGKWVVVRVGAPIWLNFGTSGVTASAATTSMLWSGAELLFKVPSTATHFAVLRIGATDISVQLELLAGL